MKSRPCLILLLLSMSAFVAIQCQTTQPAQPMQTTPSAEAANDPAPGDIRIVVVSHGQAADPFWSVVKNGVYKAAQDLGVQVEYHAPETFDLAAMAQLIDDAVASQPDGLVLSIPDADALAPSIKAAVAAGIPVISMNSGSDVAQELGVLTHVGQLEYEAGFGAGRHMAAAGVRKALCINQEVGNAALDQRCEGFADALAQVGGTSDILAIDANDPAESQNRILMALDAMPQVDGILTLGPTGALPALTLLRKEGLQGKIKLATFDLAPEILEAIRDGEVLFAVDQQQYMQGYLPIVLLRLYQTNANTPGDVIVRTGPGFVTKDNVATVIDLSKAGTR
jgi:simple sugar transport system substrate-binding protein